MAHRNSSYVSSKVFMAVTIHVVVCGLLHRIFWQVANKDSGVHTPPFSRYKWFRIYRFRVAFPTLKNNNNVYATPKFSRILVLTYQTTQGRQPDNRNINLKFPSSVTCNAAAAVSFSNNTDIIPVLPTTIF